MQTVALIIPEILPEKQSNMLEAMQRLEPWFGGGGCMAQELVFQAETQKYVFTKMKRSIKNVLRSLQQSANTEVL